MRHLAAALVVSAAGLAAADERPIVAAASGLQFALPEVAERFTVATGHEVRLTFGASGSFRRQIAQGAPYQLYLSADESYVEALAAAGHLEDGGERYAYGRLAVIAPKGRGELVDGTLAGLRARLEAGDLGRFAIANPEHAPYGVAAREALEAAGLWEAVAPRLVLGENVTQTARFALSGETAGGIVAYSLARAPPVAARAEHALLPAEWHGPLPHRMALVRGAGPVARAFYAFLLGEEARALLREHGFEPPGEG